VNVKSTLELHINLLACFDKKKSWVRLGQEKDTLLAHEQLHFDICELSVRQLRRKIMDADLDPMEFDKQINKMFEESWYEYQLKQQQYDDETGHGIIAEKQQRWQGEIAKALNDLKE
jgi:hypothetical protein